MEKSSQNNFSTKIENIVKYAYLSHWLSFKPRKLKGGLFTGCLCWF